VTTVWPAVAASASPGVMPRMTKRIASQYVYSASMDITRSRSARLAAVSAGKARQTGRDGQADRPGRTALGHAGGEHAVELADFVGVDHDRLAYRERATPLLDPAGLAHVGPPSYRENLVAV
jgi:hypothetical protein